MTRSANFFIKSFCIKLYLARIEFEPVVINSVMRVLVRLARSGEWDKLVDIYRRKGQKEEIDLVTEHAQQEFPEIGTRRIIWFAEKNDTVIGAIQLLLDSFQKDLADGVYRGMIHHLRVSDPFQSSGIGSLLNRAVEDEAKRIENINART